MTLGVRELTCSELVDFLAHYFAGELSLDERSVFERHLAECPDCAAYLRSYAETIQLARDTYAGDPVPAGVPEALVRAILDARERPPRSPIAPSGRSRRRS
jgi:anti-sigma factor RsiW